MIKKNLLKKNIIKYIKYYKKNYKILRINLQQVARKEKKINLEELCYLMIEIKLRN